MAQNKKAGEYNKNKKTLGTGRLDKFWYKLLFYDIIANWRQASFDVNNKWIVK